jgi:hypothetical protein
LIADIENEIQEEKTANEEVEKFVQQLRQKLDSLPSLSADEAQKLLEESDKLQPEFNNLVSSHIERSQNHRYVEAEWPTSAPSAGDIDEMIQLLKSGSLQRTEIAEAEHKCQELDEEYAPLMEQAVLLLQKYADNSPKTSDEVHTDADSINNLLAAIQPLRNRYQNLLHWLTQSKNIPEQQLQAFIDPTMKQIERLDAAHQGLSDLSNQISSEIEQQDHLGRQKEALSQKFNQIQEEASRAHQVEDPDKRQEELVFVQRQMQPLVEELKLVRSQLQTERPILSATKENSQLLTRLHDDALNLNESLSSGSQEAAKKAKLSRIEHEAQLFLSRIADEISGAEYLLNGKSILCCRQYLIAYFLVEGSPSMGQLRQAARKLDQLPSEMESANAVFKDLDESDEPTKQLKVNICVVSTKINHDIFRSNLPTVSATCNNSTTTIDKLLTVKLTAF